MKLNLGCGFDIKKNYLNADIIPGTGIDIVYDFEHFPYPFEDDTFSEIYCSMVMEHIHKLNFMIDELVRISKHKAQIQIIVPYFSSPNLWGDMTHVRGFNLNTFSGFHANSLKSVGNIQLKKQRIHFFSNRQFMKSSLINFIPDFFINLFPYIYERFFAYRFPAVEIHYLLEVRKSKDK